MRFKNNHAAVITIPLHLFGIASLVFLVQSGEWHRLTWAIAFWVAFSGFGIAIGYHRLLSHRAFETTPLIRHALATLGIFAGQCSPYFWVVVHRGFHHRFSDHEGDPHSPKDGLFHSFIGWQVKFDPAKLNPRLAVDIVRDPYLKAISVHYNRIYWAFALVMFAIDWRFALGSLIPGMIAAMHQENIVNTVCHLRSIGYRNFDTPDNSNNVWILGCLLWGQALHNNHHRYPKRWNFAIKPWEFDPCALFVPLLTTNTDALSERYPEKM